MIKLETFIIGFLVLTNMITSFDVAHTKKRCKHLTVGHGQCRLCENKAICNNVNVIPNFEETITILEMQNNEILELTETSFSHQKYTRINLGNNSISRIVKDTFSDLYELEMLDLSNNKILFLNENVFANTTELDELYLQNNPHLNFSTRNLPQSLKKLNLQNTNTFILLSDLSKLRDLHIYKGKLCIDDNCNSYLEIGGTLCTHTTDIPQACIKETDDVVSADPTDNFSSKSTSYKTMEKCLDQHMNTLQGLATSTENIYKQISKLENSIFKFNDSLHRINMSLGGLRSEVGDVIHKIHDQYTNITMQLFNLNSQELDFTWLYVLMGGIVVLQGFILGFLVKLIFDYKTKLQSSSPKVEESEHLTIS